MVNLNQKNLSFLNGPQANIDALKTNGGATEGAFYLTDDTHRLYIGAYNNDAYEEITDMTTVRSRFSQGFNVYGTKTTNSRKILLRNVEDAVDNGYMTEDGKKTSGSKFYQINESAHCIPIPVNAGIEEVASIGGLPIYPNNPNANTTDSPETGAPTFYYVKDGNILCVYGEVEPATYSQASVGTFDPEEQYYSYSNGIYSPIENNAGINSSNVGNYYIKNPAKYSWIQINSDTFITSIETETNNNTATITLKANNTNEGNINPSFNIKSGNVDTLTIDKDRTDIRITAKPLSLETAVTAADASIKLTGQTASGGTPPTITLAKGKYMGDFTEESGKITINGISQEINNFQIDTNNDTGETTLVITQDNNFNIGDTTQKQFNVSLPPVMYGGTGIKSTHLGKPLSVYTISEVDNLIAGARGNAVQSANAMRYKGILTSDTSPTLEDVIAYGALDNTTTNESDTFIKDSLYYGIGRERPESGNYYYKDDTGDFKIGNNEINLGENEEWYKQAVAVVGDTWRIGATMKDPLSDTQKAYFSDSAIGMFNGREPSTQIKLHKGDLIIANSDHKWDIVPAGDEPVYNLKTATTTSNEKYLELADAEGFAVSSHQLITDENLTIGFRGDVANSTSITLKHTDQTDRLLAREFTYNKETYKNKDNTDATLSSDSNTFIEDLTLIKTMTVDRYGHITNLDAIRVKQNQLNNVTAENNGSGVTYTITDKLGKIVRLVQNYQQIASGNSGIHFDVSTSGNSSNINATFKWGSF